MFKEYVLLTKPGIIFGNLVTAIGGFLLASKGQFNLLLFLGMIFGLSFIVGAGCVFNNYQDRFIDEKMKRTKNRSLVKGSISLKHALLFGSFLFILSSFIFIIFTNILTFGIAFFGFAIYVFVYTPMKRKSVHGTLIGSVAGAIPPVVGYCAYSNHLDLAALILFAMITFWQMPHFYAIALYRIDDYSEANIPILPLVKGIKETKMQMFFYVIAFCLSVILLNIAGFTGTIYLIVTLLFSIIWIIVSIKGFKATNDNIWAKKMFRLSLIIVMAISTMMSIDYL